MIGPADLALIEWRQPLAGLLALLPLAMRWRARRRSRRIAGWADAELQAWAVQPAATPPGLRLRIALEALGWVMLAIALAGPRMAVEAPRCTSHCWCRPPTPCARPMRRRARSNAAASRCTTSPRVTPANR